MFPFFGIIIMIIFIIAILLLPCIIAAALFEWAVSRWKGVEFNAHRFRTLLILCIALRILLPTSTKLNTQCRRVVDVFSGHHNCCGKVVITEFDSYL